MGILPATRWLHLTLPPTQARITPVTSTAQQSGPRDARQQIRGVAGSVVFLYLIGANRNIRPPILAALC